MTEGRRLAPQCHSRLSISGSYSYMSSCSGSTTPSQFTVPASATWRSGVLTAAGDSLPLLLGALVLLAALSSSSGSRRRDRW
jgi:hypothetical protein